MSTHHLAHYKVGAELARYVRSRAGQGRPLVTALQAVVSDIAAITPNLAIPLRDLVSRQGFQVLIPLAGSGSGELQRKALIDDIRQLYHPDVAQALVEVLNGFLELRSETATRFEKSLDNTTNITPGEAQDKGWVYATCNETFTGGFKPVPLTEEKQGSEMPVPHSERVETRPKVVEEQIRKHAPRRGYLVLSGRAIALMCGSGITLVFIAAALSIPSPVGAFSIAIAGLLITWVFML